MQRTTLASSTEEKCKEYAEKLKKETIQSALKELEDASERCNIPSINQFLSATKETPLDWNALESFTEPSSLQNGLSFTEQRQAIKICTEAIDDYANIFKSSMLKSCTIRGYAGSGKSWCMQYCMLHYFSLGLIDVPTSVMARRSVFLGSKHIDHMFCLPFDKKNMSAYKIAEAAISRLQRYPEKLNLLRMLDVLFFDEIGQLPAEIFAAIEIILRRVPDSNEFMGGVIIISTMDHTQLQPVAGRPFLLSLYVITCFKMVKLEI